MSTDHLISRPAYTGPCTHCGTTILIAIEAGMTIAADITTAGIHAEIAAWISKRYSWELIRDKHTRQSWLRFRGLHQIRQGRNNPVVTGHRCTDGTNPAVTWLLPKDRNLPPRKPRTSSLPQKAPF